MYFLLAGVIDKFHYLKMGLAAVLLFVGTKMVIVHWYKVPIALSLGAIAGILALSVIASLIWPKKNRIESAPLENQ
jgi:tellurite resistance protein TerC